MVKPYRNLKSEKTGVYITLEQKKWADKNGLNISYFLREKLQAHIEKYSDEKY